MANFFSGIMKELKLITWPTKEHFYKACIAVFIFCSIAVVFVGGIDYVLRLIITLLGNLVYGS